MKALIAGGGIGGPVTAMALQQVGIDATVYEAYPPADPEVGSYLAITANGLEGLAAIGAFDLARAAGFPPAAMCCGITEAADWPKSPSAQHGKTARQLTP